MMTPNPDTTLAELCELHLLDGCGGDAIMHRCPCGDHVMVCCRTCDGLLDEWHADPDRPCFHAMMWLQPLALSG